ALRDISFEIPPGQFLGIAGPNGCGKSTLLKILCRIYQADSGYARVNGEFSAFLELGVGFNPELTARENIFLGGAVLGLTRAQLRDKVDEVLAVGDASFQEKCFDAFSRYKREGKTIVLVSHDLGSLEEYCDRVILLNRGEIIADGPAVEVTSAYHRMIAEHALATQRASPTELSRGDPSQWGSRAIEFASVSLIDASGQRS